MHKILVIDDEEPIRRLILMALRKKGFAVIEAESGEQGIELARTNLPDLVLSDVKMAKMDGYMVLAELRSDPRTTAIPVILMTGQPHPAGMRQGMELGADDYLPKPFTVPAMLAAVDARLKKQDTLRLAVEQKLADLRANISLALPHELFTPLSGIIGFAEILSTEAAQFRASEIAEIGRSINLSAKRLYRLIENFLIYAQIELLSGDLLKVASLRQKVALRTEELIESCARRQADETGRSADLILELTPSTAALSEEYLTKIVNEIMDNALKFSAPGSSVHVVSSVVHEWFELVVRDQGRGMTPQQIADIGAYMQFERKLYEQQGSGLGLAITKRLAELHRGSLAIRSEPGIGTTVTVTLPRSPMAPASV
jgi:two-component system, sensor histidine kinase and response regulator